MLNLPIDVFERAVWSMLTYLIVTAVVEFILMMTFRDKLNAHEEDPDALSYTAYKDYDETLGYFPGKSYYDDKHRRTVTMYRYKWEYMGKKHSVMFTDNPNNQWEHYLMTFPEEITITINRKNGKLYRDKGERAVLHKYLLMLAVSFVIAAILMYVIPASLVMIFSQLRVKWPVP